MFEVILKYLSIPAIIGFIITFLSIFKSSEVERQFETNTQRTIRDAINIVMLFMSLLFILFIIILLTSEKKNSINFSFDQSKYTISGKVVDIRLKKIFFVTSTVTKIDVKNGKYKSYIKDIKEGERYYLKDTMNNEILTGKIPTKYELKRDVERQNLVYGFYIIGLCLIYIGVVYYHFLPSWKKRKRKLYIKESNSSENREFYTSELRNEYNQELIILQSLSNNHVLLQKRKIDERGIYQALEVYKVVDFSYLSDKELIFEKTQDVKNRRIMSIYYDYENINKRFLSIYILCIFLILFLLLVCGVYFKDQTTIQICSFCLVVLIVTGCYINRQYHRGKNLVKVKNDKWIISQPFIDYFEIFKKYVWHTIFKKGDKNEL